jgi:ribA/ribD-fused uncharacterized protein
MTAILDIQALRRAARSGKKLKYRLFWGHRPRKDGALSDACFSQWWSCRFAIDGHSYSSAEQYMMAAKARLFQDDETRQRILSTPDPGRAKALGRQVRNFVESTWEATRFDLVTVGNLAKFGQNDEMRSYLLSTREQILVEASPVDRIWGIGLAADSEFAENPLEWRGLNLLGFALIRTRAILRGDLPAPQSTFLPR